MTGQRSIRSPIPVHGRHRLDGDPPAGERPREPRGLAVYNGGHSPRRILSPVTSTLRFVRSSVFAVLILLHSLAFAAPTGTPAPASTPADAPATRTATPRVGMVTMQPGEEFWSRFGHD